MFTESQTESCSSGYTSQQICRSNLVSWTEWSEPTQFYSENLLKENLVINFIDVYNQLHLN